MRPSASRPRRLLIASVLVLSACDRSAAPPAAQATTSGCQVAATHGQRLRGGMVDDRATAQRMADAVIDEEYRQDRRRFGKVEVTDKGRYWDALLGSRGRSYGGALYFQIDKCTGGLSHFEFQE